MKLQLKRDWIVKDAATGLEATIPAGIHEVERISNPLGFDAPWLVLKATKVGATELSWRQWKNGLLAGNAEHPNFGNPIDWEESEVIILDDDTPVEGFIIVNSEGATLSRDLSWSSNQMVEKGYVHTEESLDIIRLSCRGWDMVPIAIFPAIFFDGTIILAGGTLSF